MIIAIDGPAGSGKSSVAKVIAQKLNLTYLDTGAMYRAVTYFMLTHKIDINKLNEVELEKKLNEMELSIENNKILLNGTDVSKKIRGADITSNISEIAANGQIRGFLVNLQQKIGASGDSILDGRDIGTVVFPKAEYKFYLVASPEVRAKRRFKEYQENNVVIDFSEVLERIVKRDFADENRLISPLKQAEDAILIDTSEMKFEEVINNIIEKVKNEA